MVVIAAANGIQIWTASSTIVHAKVKKNKTASIQKSQCIQKLYTIIMLVYKAVYSLVYRESLLTFPVKLSLLSTLFLLEFWHMYVNHKTGMRFFRFLAILTFRLKKTVFFFCSSRWVSEKLTAKLLRVQLGSGHPWPGVQVAPEMCPRESNR